MTAHTTGTREEWLAARKKLLEREKALAERNDELAKERRELPWVRVDKEYRFDTDRGPKTLAELFDGRSQLVVYHFMFRSDWTAGCPGCSFAAGPAASYRRRVQLPAGRLRRGPRGVREERRRRRGRRVLRHRSREIRDEGGAGSERLRARGRRRLPHLLGLPGRLRSLAVHLQPAPRPGAARGRRRPHGAPPRRVRPMSSRHATTTTAAVATLGLAAGCWILSVRRMSGMNMGVATDLGSFGSFVGIWVPMMAAMMLPAAVPAVAAFERASHRPLAAPRFVGSYLAVWAVFGVVVYALYRRHDYPSAGALVVVAGVVLAQKLLPPRAILDVPVALGIVGLGILVAAHLIA